MNGRLEDRLGDSQRTTMLEPNGPYPILQETTGGEFGVYRPSIRLL